MPIVKQRLLLRTTWLKLHLYLALSAGLFLALIGLSGSLNVYRDRIDTFFNPALRIAHPSGQPQSLDRIFAALQQAHPQRQDAWTLEMPRTPEGMITAWYEKPRETFFEWHAPLMVSINPYTAEVVANRFWGQTLTTWLMDLHTQLLADAFGWDGVGFFGILLCISVMSGLLLWWPGWSGLLYTVKLRLHLGQRTLLFDVHRNLGVLSAPALLLLGITGISLSYPSLLESLTGSTGMAHGETGRVIVSTADPTKHPTSLAGAVFIARSAFPNAELRRISTPVGDTGVYRINFRQTSEINAQHPYTTVWVDHWSGQIKAIRNPEQFSTGERLASWMWPLHTGEALGELGRFVWFLAGFALVTLYVSGVFVWLLRIGKLKDKPINTALWRKQAEQRLHAALCIARRYMALARARAPHVEQAVRRASRQCWQSLMRYWRQLRQQKKLPKP